MTRAADRLTFEMPVRVSLLETDLDNQDRQLQELNDRLGKILWTLVGLLVSVTTSVVLLLINVLVKS